eukprot:5606585-Prymnesium_polylepis.1
MIEKTRNSLVDFSAARVQPVCGRWPVASPSAAHNAHPAAHYSQLGRRRRRRRDAAPGAGDSSSDVSGADAGASGGRTGVTVSGRRVRRERCVRGRRPGRVRGRRRGCGRHPRIGGAAGDAALQSGSQYVHHFCEKVLDWYPHAR